MASTDRVRLVVLFGGQSAEHEVSCTTAAHVLRAADPARYDLVPVGITREGAWVRADAAVAALAQGASALPDRLDAAGTALEPLPTVTSVAEGLPVVVLPLLHGPHGEDGTVQGLLELAGVPYVGSGVLASALCMDKIKAKEILGAHGLPQGSYLALRDTELDGAASAVAAAGLAYPLFVKPANMGSSVGVSKVSDPADLDGALALAAGYDEWLVVEEGVVAREIEVGVLGNGDARASVPGEIVSSHEFYDYEDKYLDGTCNLVIPAPLDEATTARVRELALEAYRVLRCEGLARVDFFLTEDGRGLLVNEVNTIPGFTPTSMYPQLWQASGLPYADLIDELVRLAVDRHEHRSRFSTKR
ncbi:MAG TPA: D-alanine--D-alanine ligase family protein [Acidimicrobiales bacterium]|nr:D-alanine--D-alanine ligase family protein [Acidimicrobiales bacterium]